MVGFVELKQTTVRSWNRNLSVGLLLCGLCMESGCKRSESQKMPTNGEQLRMPIERNKYPGPLAHVLYNVPPYVRTPEDDEEAEYNADTRELRRNHPADRFFCTITEPLPIEGSEFAAIDLQAERSIKEFINEHRIPRLNELGHCTWYDMDEFIIKSGNNRGCLEPLDRSLVIPLTDHTLYSPAFIRMLQTKVLSKHSTWRFLVLLDAAGYEHKHLVPLAVYPDAVVTGTDQQWNSDEQDERVAKWQDDTRRVFDHTRGSEIRQLRCVAHRLPKLLKRLEAEPLVVVVAADNWDGDTTRHTIWILQKVKEMVLFPIAFPGFAGGQAYYVTADGRLSQVYRKEQVYVYPRVVPHDSDHRLTFQYHKSRAREWEILPGVEDQAIFEIRVQPSEIVTDAELKADPNLQTPLNIEFEPDPPMK